MAFLGAFSPVLGPASPRSTSLPGSIKGSPTSTPITSPGISPHASPHLPELPMLDDEPPEFVLDGEPESPAGDGLQAQFAPMMATKRAQALEAGTMEESWKQQPTAEDRLQDALSTMEALNEATLSVAEMKRCCSDPKLGGDGSSGTAGEPQKQSPKQSPKLSPRSLDYVSPRSSVECVAAQGYPTQAGGSSSSKPAAVQPRRRSTGLDCDHVEGFVGVEFGAELDGFSSYYNTVSDKMRRALRVALLKMLTPTSANGLNIVVTEPHSSVGPRKAPSSGKSASELAFQVVPEDRHDVEPLHEILLLEAECGGARQLLPFFMEELMEEDVPLRHLRIDMEVSRASLHGRN